METNKITRLYSLGLLDYSLIQSEKKLDQTLRSSLKLDYNYAYMHISILGL
jgi:hypothetical protein